MITTGKTVNFHIWLTVKFIVIKLFLKGKKNIQVKKSPYSESMYITYFYESMYGNYIEIRVSTHYNRSSKSHIQVYVNKYVNCDLVLFSKLWCKIYILFHAKELKHLAEQEERYQIVMNSTVKNKFIKEEE